ncbi:MAG: ABC transporter permease, partial [Pedobacter agri]
MDNSPSKKVWLKFKRNKLAFSGLIFILLLVLMGILGYIITPDSSPNANTQILPLSKKKPGSTFKFIIINKNPNIKTVGFFERMLSGQKSNVTSIPITSYRLVDNNVFITPYIGDEGKAQEIKYRLNEICPRCTLHSKLGTVATLFEQYNVYEKTYWLGTDIYGRDLLSRMILGIRVSLSVGLMAVLISLFIGVSLGAIAGYFGGRIDAGISWFMNVVWSLPSLLLVIAISFALGKGFWQIFIAVGLSTWVDV